MRAIGKTGWADGFAITVDQASATPDSGAVRIDLKLTYKNLVAVSHTPTDTAYLIVNGAKVSVQFKSPEVAGSETATGTATASIDTLDSALTPNQVLDSVTLVYGNADDNQTRIPFKAGVAVTSLEPRGITVGQIFGDAPSFELSNSYLWPSYASGEKGKFELWVEFNVRCANNFGDAYLDRGSFSVTQPGGKTVSADHRSPFCCQALGGIDSSRDNWLVFVIDSPAKGDYLFHVLVTQTGSIDASTHVSL
ncbi:hypothetical protein GCM10027167_82760 [Nocardia heshunensis]